MKKLAAILFLLFFISNSFAQKAKIDKGKWKDLKDIQEYKVEFDYHHLEIADYESEEAFLKDKMQLREERKEGDGERFKKSWFADRQDKYEPQFIDFFNSYHEDFNVKVSNKREDANYVMHIQTTFIYPGYNVGVWREDSKLRVTVTIYSIKNPNNILFSANIKGIKGGGAKGFDYNSGDRIAYSYALLANYIAKKIRIVSK
ncbi:hypothetical protein [Lacinutrix himadriensis]|uniref:hypothetical protein n=1 Tax=Lacinutrix himadriensis TaxID=641549 RepID=UPI0006E1AA03|nr:hypothetical protein [Lacinutrix himadriensis]